MRISPLRTEIARLRKASGKELANTKIAVARMVAGLRYSLFKKESAENPSDLRLIFFQDEESARWSNRRLSEAVDRGRMAKGNRAQIRYALGCRVSTELRKQGLPKLEKPTATALDLLGCDIPYFFLHLERHFRDGMEWWNFGEWHIDHIIPCSAFDFRIEENLRLCFNFSNMQPLWEGENFAKGNKIYEASFSY